MLVNPVCEGDTTFLGMPVIQESNGLTSGVLTAARLIQTPRSPRACGTGTASTWAATRCSARSTSSRSARATSSPSSPRQGAAARAAAIANAFAAELSDSDRSIPDRAERDDHAAASASSTADPAAQLATPGTRPTSRRRLSRAGHARRAARPDPARRERRGPADVGLVAAPGTERRRGVPDARSSSARGPRSRSRSSTRGSTARTSSCSGTACRSSPASPSAHHFRLALPHPPRQAAGPCLGGLPDAAGLAGGCGPERRLPAQDSRHQRDSGRGQDDDLREPRDHDGADGREGDPDRRRPPPADDRDGLRRGRPLERLRAAPARQRAARARIAACAGLAEPPAAARKPRARAPRRPAAARPARDACSSSCRTMPT